MTGFYFFFHKSVSTGRFRALIFVRSITLILKSSREISRLWHRIVSRSIIVRGCKVIKLNDQVSLERSTSGLDKASSGGN